MSRACSICRHPKSHEIDTAAARGLSNRDIARRYRVTKSAVDRHREHIVDVLAKATEAKEVSRADRLLGEVEALRGRAMSLLEKAEGERAFTAAAGLIREARGCLELLGRLAGELAAPSISLVVSPEWSSVRAAILRALEAHPAARAAVVAALMQREALGAPEAPYVLEAPVTAEVIKTVDMMPPENAP